MEVKMEEGFKKFLKENRVSSIENDDVSNDSKDFIDSFIYRPPLSIVKMLSSDSDSIRRFMSCNWDEVFILRFTSETNYFFSKLENLSHLSFEREFIVSGNRWKEKSCSLFRIPGEDIPVFPRDYGILIRRRDWEKVSKFILDLSLSPSSYQESALEKVYWTEKTESLKNDIKFFSNSKHWFDKRDLPYARSYLLYGSPGNGKTSAIRAISQYFHSTPEQFSFTGRYEDPDSSFLKWISGDEYSNGDYDAPRIVPERRISLIYEEEENPRVRILLLEDIDRFFSKEEGFKTPVSFSAILNALDGIAQRKNSILIATANNPEKIDSQVLFRPGRFDLRIPFDSPSKDGIFNFMKKLSEEDAVSDDVIAKVSEMSKGHSFAFVKGIYMAAANRAFARSSQVISDEDIIHSMSEFLNNMGNNIKSIKSGAGF